jgi:hypothetical protein
MTGFDEISQRYHSALEAFIQGDPEPVLKVWSKRDDATWPTLGLGGSKAVRDASVRPLPKLLTVRPSPLKASRRA